MAECSAQFQGDRRILQDFKRQLGKKVVSHASYLINPRWKRPIREKASRPLISELERCSQLSIGDVVLHPGFALEDTWEDALAKVSLPF